MDALAVIPSSAEVDRAQYSICNLAQVKSTRRFYLVGKDGRNIIFAFSIENVFCLFDQFNAILHLWHDAAYIPRDYDGNCAVNEFEDSVLLRILSHIEHRAYIDMGDKGTIDPSSSRSFYKIGWCGFHVTYSSASAGLLKRQRPDEQIIQASVGLSPKRGYPDFRDNVHHTGSGVVETIPMSAVLDQFKGQDDHWLNLRSPGSEGDVMGTWGASCSQPWVVAIQGMTSSVRKPASQQPWECALLKLEYDRVGEGASNHFSVSTLHPDLKASFVAEVGHDDRGTEIMSRQRDELQQEMAALSDRIATRQMNMEFALDDLREDLIDELDRLRKVMQPATEVVPLAEWSDPGAPDMIKTIRALEAAIHERDRTIAALRSSSSWRITRPLRLIHRLVRSPRGATRDIAVLTLRWALTKPMLRRPGMLVADRLPKVVKDKVKRIAIVAPPEAPVPGIASPVSTRIGDLNPTAKTVYAKLKRAIAARDNR